MLSEEQKRILKAAEKSDSEYIADSSFVDESGEVEEVISEKSMKRGVHSQSWLDMRKRKFSKNFSMEKQEFDNSFEGFNVKEKSRIRRFVREEGGEI